MVLRTLRDHRDSAEGLALPCSEKSQTDHGHPYRKFSERKRNSSWVRKRNSFFSFVALIRTEGRAGRGTLFLKAMLCWTEQQHSCGISYSAPQGKLSGEGADSTAGLAVLLEPAAAAKGNFSLPRIQIPKKFCLPTRGDLILIEWMAVPQATLFLLCHRLQELACSSSSFPALAISPGIKIKQISVAQHHLLQSWSISSAVSQEPLLYFTLILGTRLMYTAG